jgi:hypothetical protein
MLQTFSNAIGIGLNTLIERGRQKSDAGKVRIDQEGVTSGFKLETINAEISDADRLARHRRICVGIGGDKDRIFFETRECDLGAQKETKNR